MSGIYIKGMEMPKGKDVLTVAITADGEVYSIGFDNTIEGGIFLSHPSTYPIQAVPVPPHGRLGDLDALEKVFREDAREEWNKWAKPLNWADAFDDVADIVGEEPTVIPADEEETE